MGKRGHRFSEELKRQAVQEVLSGESQASVARRHSVSVNSLSDWLKSYRAGRLGGEATSGPDVQRVMVELRKMQERVAHLERLLGKKEAEIDFLKKLESFEADLNNGSFSVMSGRGRSRGKKNVR